jgi:hypothetical protein
LKKKLEPNSSYSHNLRNLFLCYRDDNGNFILRFFYLLMKLPLNPTLITNLLFRIARVVISYCFTPKLSYFQAKSFFIRGGVLFCIYGCLIVANTDYRGAFFVKMFVIPIPFPICMIIGTNRSIGQTEF